MYYVGSIVLIFVAMLLVVAFLKMRHQRNG